MGTCQVEGLAAWSQSPVGSNNIVFLPSLNALCLVQSCDKYWSTAKNDPNVKKACAVLFDENCCKATKPQYVVPKGESGKLCGVKGSLFSSSCKGPKLKDDVESPLVMPGCKLEVWDKGDGQEQAAKEEKKSANAGNLRDNKDRYNRNKLVFTATGKPHWVEELNDDFDDMDEDIESYRCTCN